MAKQPTFKITLNLLERDLVLHALATTQQARPPAHRDAVQNIMAQLGALTVGETAAEPAA